VPAPLDEAVVVITGASSGIGAATARAMAARGSRLVLAARRERALEGVRADCASCGATAAIAVPTDVTDETAVAALARRAVEHFGGIDVWVNNAGVMLYGRFEDTPSHAYRRVIETNLFGQIHGARAAVPVFRRQGRGVLVNMSSVWGRVSSPYVSAYVTSKFAIRAFSECLREELADAHEIHVVTILPQAVDTPIWRRAGNFSGREARPLPFSRTPEEIAERVMRCAEDPKREVTDRRFGRLVELVHTIAPPVWEFLTPRLFAQVAFDKRPAEASTGNLFVPDDQEEA
jgi:NAD(P)-dependent dehydrogenase (short-subunit alcohol dehydrogenase family)